MLGPRPSSTPLWLFRSKPPTVATCWSIGAVVITSSLGTSKGELWKKTKNVESQGQIRLGFNRAICMEKKTADWQLMTRFRIKVSVSPTDWPTSPSASCFSTPRVFEVQTHQEKAPRCKVSFLTSHGIKIHIQKYHHNPWSSYIILGILSHYKFCWCILNVNDFMPKTTQWCLSIFFLYEKKSTKKTPVCFYFPPTLPKFNSSPLKSDRDPIGKDHLPTIFQWLLLLNFGGSNIFKTSHGCFQK